MISYTGIDELISLTSTFINVKETVAKVDNTTPRQMDSFIGAGGLYPGAEFCFNLLAHKS